jgi:3-oxoacyl-[acyl-carrier-protein] synthase II
MYRMDETGESAANAVKLALDDAGIKPSDVDYVNAHGSSSPVSDCRETKVLKDVFGDHAHKLKISSIKSMIGHALGAAGSIQLAATILSGSNGYITPTINYNKPDPLCDLDYVPNESIRKKINVALVNSFGMGGNNASVVARIF